MDQKCCAVAKNETLEQKCCYLDMLDKPSTLLSSNMTLGHHIMFWAT